MPNDTSSITVAQALVFLILFSLVGYGSYLASDAVFKHLLSPQDVTQTTPPQAATGANLGLLSKEQYEVARADIRLASSIGADPPVPAKKSISYRDYLRGRVGGENLYLYNGTKKGSLAHENVQFFEDIGFSVVRIDNTSRPYPTSYMAGGTGSAAIAGLLEMPFWKWVKTPNYASSSVLGEDWNEQKARITAQIENTPEIEISLQ